MKYKMHWVHYVNGVRGILFNWSQVDYPYHDGMTIKKIINLLLKRGFRRIPIPDVSESLDALPYKPFIDGLEEKEIFNLGADDGIYANVGSGGGFIADLILMLFTEIFGVTEFHRMKYEIFE